MRLQVGKRAVEQFVLFRQAAHAVPERLAKNVNEACLARLYAVAQGRSGLPKVIATPKESGIAKAARPVAKKIGYPIIGKFFYIEILSKK